MRKVRMLAAGAVLLIGVGCGDSLLTGESGGSLGSAAAPSTEPTATSIEPIVTSTEPTVASTEPTSTSIEPAVITGYAGTISCPSGYREIVEVLVKGIGDARTPEEAARNLTAAIHTSQDLSSATYEVAVVDSRPGGLDVWVHASDGEPVGFVRVEEYPEAGVFLAQTGEFCPTIVPPTTPP